MSKVFLHIPLIEGEEITVIKKEGKVYVVSTLNRFWKQTVKHPHTDMVEMTQDEIEEIFEESYDDGYPDD